MTDLLFQAILNDREFGSSVFHVGDLSEWLKLKRLHLRSIPEISEFKFVQVEALLCAIERAAKCMTFKEAYIEVAKDPMLASDPVAKIAPVWLLSAEAHRQWRKKFEDAVSAGELQLLNVHSYLPIADTVRVEQPLAPILRSTAQDEGIIDKLKFLGYEPLKLPKPQTNKPGAKSKVKAALGNQGIWAGKTVFNKAWERLASYGDIAYLS